MTFVLIAISIIIAIISDMGSSREVLRYFLIVDPFQGNASEIWRSEFWRLITPIFIHYGILHLFFNMTCLKDAGTLLELKRGPLFFCVFIVVIGVLSNYIQYHVTGSPFFGGMSGVVYGLFGYIWMQGKYNRHFGAALSQGTVIMMVGWFFLCWTGLLGAIANWAHTAGLGFGVLWGYLESQKSDSILRIK